MALPEAVDLPVTDGHGHALHAGGHAFERRSRKLNPGPDRGPFPALDEQGVQFSSFGILEHQAPGLDTALHASLTVNFPGRLRLRLGRAGDGGGQYRQS